MKKLLFVFALFLTACGGSAQSLLSAPEITPEMNASMTAYADQYDVWYPGNEQNIARECADNPTAVYWSDELKAFAVTCPLPWSANSFGMVTFDESGTLLNAFGLGANSQGELSKTLATLGWKR